MQWNACIEKYKESDETDADLKQKLEKMQEQLQPVPLNELCHKSPERYRQLMQLKDAVTDEVITDVWSNPHSELIEHIDTLCQFAINNDDALNNIINQPGGILEILRTLAHCEAFVHTSVADKALLLVTTLGCLEFENFRTILKVFFGLNDVQILAILFGHKNNGGLLRIVQTETVLLGIVEPVYCTGHLKYADRTSQNDLLLYFYPYIPQDCDWTHTHKLYHAYMQLINGKDGFDEETMQLTKLCAVIHSNSSDSEYPYSSISHFPENYLLYIIESSNLNIPDDKQSMLLQVIAISGIPMHLSDLMNTGHTIGLSELEVMHVIIQHLDDLMICQDGESIRIKRVSEYKQCQYFDREWSDAEECTAGRRLLSTTNSTKIQNSMQAFREHYDSHLFHNLAEKVHTFLILHDAEIKLKDLMKVCLQLGLTASPKSVSRVLKAYNNKFFSCESIGKRGVWCCRETAIRLGYNVDSNKDP